ncbi:MAG: hypothetical protein AAF542_24480 [Pseudomonadota bacterium]
MKNKTIICAACVLFSPFIQGSDTTSANITLHIPANYELSAKTAAADDYPHVVYAEADFCVGSTSGLQFSIESDDPTSSSELRLASVSTLDEPNAVRNSRAKECHERNSGILKITQLPQGKRTITAVVVAE